MLRRTWRALETGEAAITLGVALLVTIAFINLGMAVYANQAAQYAANYGARMGSTAQCDRAGAALAAAQSNVKQSLLQSPSVQVLARGEAVGSTLKIRVSGTVPNFMKGILGLFGGGFSQDFRITAESVFRAEGWGDGC